MTDLFIHLYKPTPLFLYVIALCVNKSQIPIFNSVNRGLTLVRLVVNRFVLIIWCMLNLVDSHCMLQENYEF